MTQFSTTADWIHARSQSPANVVSRHASLVSSVGATLAKRLGWTFLDADDFHPAANVEKMSKGIPLNDEDRMPWLRRLHDELEHRIGLGASVVLGCSALKESYRQIMQEGLSRIDFVFLDVDQLALTERLGKRKDHFFP